MQKTESIKFKICYFLSQVTSELSTSSGNFGSLSERTDDFEKQIHLEKEQVQKKEAELKVSYNVASFTLNLLYLAKEIRTLYKGGKHRMCLLLQWDFIYKKPQSFYFSINIYVFWQQTTLLGNHCLIFFVCIIPHLFNCSGRAFYALDIDVFSRMNPVCYVYVYIFLHFLCHSRVTKVQSICDDHFSTSALTNIITFWVLVTPFLFPNCILYFSTF